MQSRTEIWDPADKAVEAFMGPGEASVEQLRQWLADLEWSYLACKALGVVAIERTWNIGTPFEWVSVEPLDDGYARRRHPLVEALDIANSNDTALPRREWQRYRAIIG